MVPDVYEVFEFLEFHYILKAFDTLQEAIADFDKSLPRGDATRRIAPADEAFAPADRERPAPREREPISKQEDYLAQMTDVEARDESIEEKIKQLVIQNPDNGSIKIMKELNTPAYGNIKLSWFQVMRYLKQLNLNSKKRRIEFFKKYTIQKN